LDRNRKIVAIKASSNLGISSNGAEPFTIEFFSRYLKEFGYEVHLVGSEDVPKNLEHLKPYFFFRINRFPRFFRAFLHLPISIFTVLIYSLKVKPDLLMCTGGVFYNGLAIFISGKIFGIKVLIRTAEDHFNYFRYTKTIWSKAIHYFFNRGISFFLLKRSDYVLTTGVKSREYFIKKGSNSKHTYGIPGRLDLNKFEKINSDFREKHSIPDYKTLVLYVGAISGVKGTDHLLEIIEKVNEASNDFFFVIVGREIEFGSRIVKDLKSKSYNNLIFLPPQQREKLKEIYSAADLLLFLCKVGVGYGQVTLEATMCKLPVLSLNPGIDVEWWLGDLCCPSTEMMIKRILSKDYKLATIPSAFNESTIKSEYQIMFKDIIEG